MELQKIKYTKTVHAALIVLVKKPFILTVSIVTPTFYNIALHVHTSINMSMSLQTVYTSMATRGTKITKILL
jgi:hypothetical protein